MVKLVRCVDLMIMQEVRLAEGVLNAVMPMAFMVQAKRIDLKKKKLNSL